MEETGIHITPIFTPELGEEVVTSPSWHLSLRRVPEGRASSLILSGSLKPEDIVALLGDLQKEGLTIVNSGQLGLADLEKIYERGKKAQAANIAKFITTLFG